MTSHPTPLQPVPDTAAHLLQQAVVLHQAGQLLEAGELYQTILQSQPGHPEANHNLGVIAVQAQQPAAGLPYFMAALDADPTRGPYWLNYIDALFQAGQHEDARAVLALAQRQGLEGDEVDALAVRLGGGAQAAERSRSKKAPTLAPKAAPRGKNPGPREIDAVVTLFNKGRYTEVATLAQKMTERFPRHAFAWKILGVALKLLGRGADALVPMQKAAALAPADVESQYNLAVTLQELGRLDEAVASYRQALAIDPAYIDASLNLGATLQATGRLDEAETQFRHALRTHPDDARAHGNLANLLRHQGRLSEAEISFRRALELRPDDIETHNSLGLTLQDLGRLDQAEACYRAILKIMPDNANIMSNLGQVLLSLGRLDEAEASFRQARQMRPNHGPLHSNLLYYLTLSPTADAQSVFAEHAGFGEQFESQFRTHWPRHTHTRDSERRLQIGFVSADFYNHAVASFIEPVLSHVSGLPQLSLHAYYNNIVNDSVTERLRGHFAHWHPVAGLSDADLAEKIGADGIDILIDLAGHTAGNRLLAFARKPAPVQVSWIGYPGTTGLRAVDYFLADRFLLPPGRFDDQFTEKIVRLPAIAPFLPSELAPPVNALPALGNGHVTFGSFNRPNKLGRAVIALWARLLRALPDSRMVLGAMPEHGQYDTLIVWFAEEGIDRSRLDFHPRSGMEDYLALHRQVDLCLDTFPYNGGTTTQHALWMGVPTLTLAGTSMPGRVGAANLSHVGLEDFVVERAEDFVERGVYWAKHLSALAELRAGLRERSMQSPLRNPERIAAALNDALRTMWRRWCTGLPAESFDAPLQRRDANP